VTPEVAGVPFDIAHHTIAIDPIVPNHLYVGTELGLWRSTDNAASWQHVGLSDGVPYAPVLDLKMNGKTDRIVAFTHGRGAYEAVLNRCVGDCNGDGVVTINELVLISNIMGGSKDLCMCAIADATRDATISSAEQAQAQRTPFFRFWLAFSRLTMCLSSCLWTRLSPAC
jgi:hypothetical protein